MEKQDSKKRGMKILSLLLVASIFLSTQGFTVFAGSISGNEGAKEWEQDDVTEAEYDEGEEGNSRPVTEDGSQEADMKHAENEDSPEEEAISAGGVSENSVRAGEGMPANPVHHCARKDDNTGEDYTDFSYIYFGTYPQSEVMDSATIEAIDQVADKYGTKADAGMDVWVNGIKYRRISKSDTNRSGNFDQVENNGYRYFKWERVKWRVLKNDGNTLFVVTDSAIDCKNYNEEPKKVTWETSTIRSWLNDSFYRTAFSEQEQSAIALQTIRNEDNPNPMFGAEGGNDTEDKIWLLSRGEVVDEEYGFCSQLITKWSPYSSLSRVMKASAYANARGTYISWEYDGGCWWWLRSPGDSDNNVYAANVSLQGLIDYDYVSVRNNGICPALHINLSSGAWSMTDDETSGEGGEKTANPKASIPTGSSVEKDTKLTLSCNTVGADIYYTTDGTLPTTESHLYTEEITIDCDMTIKAVAMYQDYSASDVVEFFYKVQQGSSEVEKREESDNKENGNKDGGSSSEENKGSNVKVQKLTIKAPSKKLAAGKKVKLTLNVTPKNATNKAVKWKTSNKKYATVKDGKITLKKKGIGKKVTISAVAADGSGRKATIRIKIMRHAVKSIKLTVPKKTLKAGKSMTIKANVKTTGKNANKVLKWKSSNKKYATVNRKGKVTAKKAGKGKTVTITVTSTDGSNKKAKAKIKIK